MAEEAIARVTRVLEDLRLGGIALPALSGTARLAEGLVKQAPPWILRFSCLADGPRVWLYCEPDPAVQYNVPGQVVLDVPPGRYFIDTFDPASRACVARESAAAPPLVIGLAHAGAPALLWIRPAADR